MKKRLKKKEETENAHSPHRHSDSSDGKGGDMTNDEGGECRDDGERGGGGGEGDRDDASANETNAEPDDSADDITRFLTAVQSQRSDPPPEISDSSVERLISTVRKEIGKHESDAHGRWSASLLGSIERLSSLSASLSYLSASRPGYSRAAQSTGRALQQAMSFLEEEFRLLLEDSATKPAAAAAAEAPDPYPPEAVEKLRRIAETMILGGYESECCQAFSIARRNAFDARLSDIGFGKVSTDEMQRMSWQSLEREVVTWVQAFRESISRLFCRERDLCESVFSGRRAIAGSLFSNLARGVVIQLLNFAEAVAAANRSAEKLFKVLDMYETLRDALPRMDSLFPGEGEAADLKSEISAARSRLGGAAVEIFCELEGSIRADAAKAPVVPGGAVHPLTRYVMNYLEYACDYSSSLEQVFAEEEEGRRRRSSSSSSRGGGAAGSSATVTFAAQLTAVMELLDSNLVSKSKLYKDPALGYVFLMNNGRYVAKKIKESAAIFGLLGSNWYRRRSSVLREYHKNYQRETWAKVLGCFREEGLQAAGKGGSAVSKPVLKERLKSFNAMVEEISKTQSVWVVCDEQLQSELRVSISAVVVPAYRSFLGRYGQHLSSGKCIKFSPEDLETCIDDLFVGNPSNHGRKRT